MDMRTIRTLMDINSLQALGAVQTYSGENGSSSSLFNIMLEEMLGNSSVSNSLSSVSTSLLRTISNKEPLRYDGKNAVFKPLTLSAVSKGTPTPVSDGQYIDIIRQAAEKYDLPDKLITSVIRQESNFNNNVTSHAGAEGLMQLMPGTAKFLGVTDSFDSAQNIMGGAKYLRQMLNQFDDNIELALAAYNAGPGSVKKYGGVPPYKETQQYVKKVLSFFN